MPLFHFGTTLDRETRTNRRRAIGKKKNLKTTPAIFPFVEV
jgi:hypothetical protein